MEANVTEFTWNAGSMYDICEAITKITYSDSFALKSDSSAKFSLFMDCSRGYCRGIKFGVIANKINEGKSVKLRVQLWVCNVNGGKFGDHIAEEVTFMNIDQKCEFGAITGTELGFLDCVYLSDLSVSFSCKLTHLNPVPNIQHSLDQKLWDLYEKEIGFDTTILAGGKEFKVSRSVLCAHSKVFQMMFSSNFKEGITGKAELKGITAPAMEAFVKWMYTGDISDNAVIEGLFIAADKYMIADLRSICANLIIKSMSEENASQRLVLAAKYNDKELKQKSLAFIHGKGQDFMYRAFQSNAWNDYMTMIRGAGN